MGYIIYVVVLLLVANLFRRWMSKKSKRTRTIVGVVGISILLLPLLVVGILEMPIKDGEPHTVNAIYIKTYKFIYDRFTDRTPEHPEVTCVFGDIQTDERDPHYNHGRFNYSERIDDENGILSKKSIWAPDGIVGGKLHIRGKEVSKGTICCIVVQDYKHLGNDKVSRKIVDIYVPDFVTDYNPEYAKRWENEIRIDSIAAERNRKIEQKLENAKQEAIQKAIQSALQDKQNRQSTESK